MASTNTPAGNANNDDGTIRLVDVDADAHVLDHAEISSNADLYIVTPPAYTQSLPEGEATVDAEAASEEKPPSPRRRPVNPQSPLALTSTSPRPASEPSIHQEPQQHHPNTQNEPQAPAYEQTAAIPERSTPAPALGYYLAEPLTTAALVGTRACSILPDRPALWLVRKKKAALSALAATILLKEGLIAPKDLALISQEAGVRRDPTDPLSGIFLSTYDTLGEMMLGIIAGPVEVGRQATPFLAGTERMRDGGVVSRSSDAKEAAKLVAIETGKGIGQIVVAGLKVPMFLSNGLARGFHNLPKVYGERVRDYENVTGWKSGLVVSAKSFGYGLGDGLVDFFAKPMRGAENNGVLGFATGFAKGIGNVVCKPAAGACGIIGYSSIGFYKSIRNIKIPILKNGDPEEFVQKLGEDEYAHASTVDKMYVVRVWCQSMMPVHLP